MGKGTSLGVYSLWMGTFQEYIHPQDPEHDPGGQAVSAGGKPGADHRRFPGGRRGRPGDDEPVHVWDFTVLGVPEWLAAALTDPESVKVAHNCQFERACLNKALGIYSPPEQWMDTMHLAAMNGLPMTLEAAGAALQLTQQKLDTGKALIRYFCKPCAPTKANGGRTRNLPEHAPEKWKQFKEYCLRDTETEREIFYRLKDTQMTETERRVECLDARINERGMGIDLRLAAMAVALDDAFKATHTKEMQRLTGLENPNSVAQLKTWLAARGLETDSLDKKAVPELMKKATDWNPWKWHILMSLLNFPVP